ncbi:MAG TPA: hypothetical protein VK393_06040 [Nocardioidaceae bacterium]|jgi:hypothetical protein|nr:hypothetical protein [Nocardioidaceae bacterium]
MTTTPDLPLGDDDIESTGLGTTGSGQGGHDADMTDQVEVDADGTDSPSLGDADSGDAPAV